jgi:hypothetical protein
VQLTYELAVEIAGERAFLAVKVRITRHVCVCASAHGTPAHMKKRITTNVIIGGGSAPFPPVK